MSWLSDTLGTSRPSAPTLPTAPTLTAPQLPNYPGMTPEEQQLLQQQQSYLQQLQQLVSGYQSNPLYQQSQQAAQQGITNYQNALSGNIPQNQMIEQQKARDWAQTVQQAAQQGIRISGDSPESAVSQSTAGNQIIQDFTKRYGALEQNYNLGQQQLGQQSLGLAGQLMGQNFQNQLGGYGQLSDQGWNLYAPYQQQQLGPWQVQTQQALSNADIANQNAMNAYQQRLMQLGLNYQNTMGGYNQRLGMIGGGLQLAGTALGAFAGPAGAMIGNQIGGSAGQMITGQQGQQSSFNPASYISAYRTPGMGMYPSVPSSAVNYGTGGTSPSDYYLYNGGK